uniref:DNA-directed DNA polymerase n=1 Tax=Cacopsylla melanoneura TaxID=428564 RepID=A0A8D8SNK6_9HEMI
MRTLMNKRRHKNFTLITNENSAATYIRKPTFKQFAIFGEDLVGVLSMKTSVLLDSPIYAGMVTLDIAKLIMYEYYYNVLKPKFGNNMKLCMTDTDSLLLHIKTDDLYCDLFDIIDTLDTSNYPSSHYLHDNTNKKMLGKFKDESPANPITKFVGLRAKMYAFETKQNYSKNVGKGIPYSCLKEMSVSIYKNSLFSEKITHVEFDTIESKNHELRMKRVRKVGLSPFDDKRFLLPDKVNTLAYGHYKIQSS